MDILHFTSPLPPIAAVVLLSTVTVVAGVLRGVTGFGAALLMAPVFSFFMSPSGTTFALLLTNIAASVQLFQESRRDIPWGTIVRLAPSALVAIPVGVWLLTALDAEVIRRIIGLVVLVLAVLLLAGWRYRGRRGLLSDSVTGLTSGLLQGIAGIGGPPVILYLMASDLSVRTARAAMSMFFGLVGVISMLALLATGEVTATDMTRGAIAVPIHLFGAYLGSIGFGLLMRWGERPVRLVSIALLLVAGLMALAL